MSIIRRPEQIFDIRLLERNKNKGLYDSKEYKKWLKELPDMKEEVRYVTAVDLFDEARQEMEESSEQAKPKTTEAESEAIE